MDKMIKKLGKLLKDLSDKIKKQKSIIDNLSVTIKNKNAEILELKEKYEESKKWKQN